MADLNAPLKTPEWLRAHPSGTVILLSVQPKASKTEITGPHGSPPRLRIRVAAPPVEGKANEELVAFFSKLLKKPKSSLGWLRGESSRQKDLRIEGLSPESMALILREWI